MLILGVVKTSFIIKSQYIKGTGALIPYISLILANDIFAFSIFFSHSFPRSLFH